MLNFLLAKSLQQKTGVEADTGFPKLTQTNSNDRRKTKGWMPVCGYGNMKR